MSNDKNDGDTPYFDGLATIPLQSVTEEVVDKRAGVYGSPVDTFPRIAQVWSGILGVEVTAADVTLCLIGMKAVRTQVTPEYADNSDDIEGYLDIFRQIVGPDMIHARTVGDFIKERDRRG